MHFIEYRNLFIELPEKNTINKIEIIAINKLKIIEEVNEHSIAEVEIIINNKDEQHGLQIINEIDTNKLVKLATKNEESEKIEVVFVGIINYTELQNDCGKITINIGLDSTSINLDIKKRRRSFQNINNSYQNLFSQIVQENSGKVSDTLSAGKKQENFLIQYDETNWEILKRCASKLHGNVLVNNLREKPYVHVGVLAGNTFVLHSEYYKVSWSGEAFYNDDFNFGGYKYHDKFYYDITSVKNYVLMDNIIFKDVKFKIVKKTITYENGIIKFSYRVLHRAGFKTTQIYNPKNVGLRIFGKVIDVKPDRLRLHLEIDETQSKEEAYWFKMTTTYPENTGFYFMPEIGSKAILYIPDMVGEQSFIKKLIREGDDGNQKIKDPNIKYIGNTTGKELRLSHNYIQITERANHNLINLKTRKGITIITSSNAHVLMNKGSFKGKNLGIKSNGEVIIATPGTSMWIKDGEVHLKAVGNVML